MRIFKEGNWGKDSKCPICGTQKEGDVTLIGIDGTQEGNNIQAIRVHVDCLEPLYYPDHSMIVQQTFYEH